MPRSYVTDIQHFLDERGGPAQGPAGEMARYLGRIIEAGSVLPEGSGRLVPLCCANPSHRKRCGGQLGAVLTPAKTIDWECTGCRERGVITNWAGTRFDLSQVTMLKGQEERADLVAPLSEFDAALRLCDLSQALRRLLVDATGVGVEYLFVSADYYELSALRDAARKAADDATGEQRRLLDRFAARADAFTTTLSEFFEPEDDPRGLLN